MSDRLLVLGAGVSYTASIRAARRAGYEVVAIDQNEEAPGFEHADHAEPVDITDIEGALAVAREYEVGGVVPVNDYGVVTAARVARELDLVGIDPAVAETCTDKARMRRAWEEAGIPQPEFGVARTLAEAREHAVRIGYPLVTKPADSTGGGSRGVSLVDGPDGLPDAVAFAQSVYDDDDRVLIEKRATGTEHSIEVVADGTGHRAVVVSDKEKTPPPYRVDKSVIYPTDSDRRAEIERVAEAATAAVGVDIGAAHVELAFTDDGPKLFELGARTGGGATPDPIVPAVTGVDYFAEVATLYMGDPASFDPTRRDGATYRFLTPPPGRLSALRNVEEVRSWEDVLDCRIWVSPGDEITQVRVGGDRSGSVITHGDTREEAYDLADRAEDRIRFVYETDEHQ